ncbi:MAG: hypothetical protein H6631_13490 [Anaerolineaceae bacterium]|nr:hypothetical protein [Anaerolineaceae bacterium]MCB9101207.1 hypothetical protein [Anaerolineales bacterium]
MAETSGPLTDISDTWSRSPLLTTKLYIPPARPNLVPRPHLTRRFDAGLTGKLTLISAPAGFGKTTVLSEWISHSRQRRVTWFTLDEGDNDPIRFWSYFIASLQRLTPGLGENTLSLFQSPQPPPLDVCLTVLLNELAAVAERFALVLDDYHYIENPTLHEAITFLLDHAPPQFHLIITTRVDPPLPLSRLRSRGQLTELRAADLRFTLAEAATFLNEVMGLNLSAEVVAALEPRTEGWIVGLQLAAMSMQGREDITGFVQAFTGSHRYILDYLTDEVLAQQPPVTQNFLLQTAILDRFCAPLCEAVTGQGDGQSTLERLEQANLFIVALDDARQWYRYHHLFAEVLQARLRQAQPDLEPVLHRRAREWLEQNGLTHEAINHALAGHDFEQAARLIERVHSVMWQKGEIKTLQAWLAAIPLSVWRTHPRLWLVQAWAAMTVGELSEADEQLREAEAALALLDEDHARSLRPEVLAFRASYASLSRDPAAVELTQQALQLLPQDYWMRGMLVVFLGAAYYATGDLHAAAEVLAQGRSMLSTPGMQSHRIHLLPLDGMVHHAQGQLRRAWSLIRQALDLVEPGGRPIPFVGTLFTYMCASQVLYDLNELDQVEIYLTRCVDQAVKFGSTESQVFALSGLAHLGLARDDLAAAENYTHQVEALLRTQTFNINIMAYVEYHHFLFLLKQNNLTAAAAWVESHTGRPGPLIPYFHHLARPQILMAQGNFDAALANLTTLVQEAQNTGHGRLLIKALVLQALVLQALGHTSQALPPLNQALSLAEPEGFIRLFVDEGEPMSNLLRQAHAHGIAPDYVTKLLAAFDAEGAGRQSRLEPVEGEAGEKSPLPPRSPTSLLIEPLSERELELLRLVADGLSNQEIAQELFLAVGTVKKHLNNIFGKLSVSSRTQAVAYARELDLL